jgi:hypothetical protein
MRRVRGFPAVLLMPLMALLITLLHLGAAFAQFLDR